MYIQYDRGKITVILIFMTEHYLTSANSHIAGPEKRQYGPEKATIRSNNTGPRKAIILSLKATIRGQKKRRYGAKKTDGTGPGKATIRGQEKRRYGATKATIRGQGKR